ncbi:MULTISPECIES: SecY-interacting protein [unclassified Gilliamella]|uniref:SecY-interacting protein n=1 Tax=unclassified Gilliamella TaxID=2685620 RepID=UPI00226A77BD|nr:MULTISPECIES: SecY-interacting protein [unclassified Gilliamella]MCX8584271.1 SecY-interacting protein [Gilliamella sp. B3372]MCX8595343.1 SecY-interacting protein [Gilliamella sp. B3367]
MNEYLSMELPEKIALTDFTHRWIAQFDGAPKSEELHSLPSPCIIKTENLTVYWQPYLLIPPRNLTIVEQIINIKIHQSAHIYYGTQYAANMAAKFADIDVILLQPWSDDDFSNLEQNLIAHLSQQKKLKRHPTLFIGSTNKDTEIIAINNLTAEIVKEDLITGQLITLAPDLKSFLEKLEIES